MGRLDDVQHGRDIGKKMIPRAKTCGTCGHVKRYPAMWTSPEFYMCWNNSAPASHASSVDPDDGCIKGWTPRTDPVILDD